MVDTCHTNCCIGLMKATLKLISLTFLATLACGAVIAQDLKKAPSRPWNGPVVPYTAPHDSKANFVFFSNLSSNPAHLYDYNSGGYYVLGLNNAIFPGLEQHVTIRFTALVDGFVTTLQAALYQDRVSPGTPQCTLGIFDTGPTGTFGSDGPGTSLGGGIVTVPMGAPNTLVTVNLDGAGVAVTANTDYWLVATTTDGASDFAGVWGAAYPRFASEHPSLGAPWLAQSGQVPAGAVKGTAP